MTMQRTIEDKIRASLTPTYLEVINESPLHSVPAGSESHFKVVVVSPAFDGKSLVARHQAVNGILATELAGGIHALALQTLTIEEWERKSGVTAASPECLGGSKKAS